MSDDWEPKFLEALYDLAPAGDRKNWNLGALAELRRGLRNETYRVLSRVGKVFVAVPNHALDDAVLIAGLFATHPQRGEGNLGASFATIRDDSGSIEKRFVALLDCEREDLDEHLRHAISLLKDKPVDWTQLLRHVRLWKREGRWVERQWARAFWAEIETTQPETASTPITVTASE